MKQNEIHGQAELYNSIEETWKSIGRYPYSDTINHYALAYYQEGFFVFGGSAKSGTDATGFTIARLDVKSLTWSNVGQMFEARQS